MNRGEIMKRFTYIILTIFILWFIWWGLEALHWNRIAKSFQYSMDIYHKSGNISAYLNAKELMDQSNAKKTLYFLISLAPLFFQAIAVCLLKYRRRRFTNDSKI